MDMEAQRDDRNAVDNVGQSRSMEWNSEGEVTTVVVAGVRITVRFVNRKGRRARIAIVAQRDATFTNSCDQTRTLALHASLSKGTSSRLSARVRR